jgi:serine/threonine-protein kinase
MAAPFGDDDDDEDPSGGDGDDAADAPPEETTLKIGALFHLFYVVRLIGRGGTSEVYEILFKGARWALKVPRWGFKLTEDQLQRFEREATMLLQIKHENVIDVQEYGYNDGVFWIRMELLDGLDLREAITRLGAMSVGLVGAWLVQAAHGVHQCHMFGLVHRDLKPENVFITRDNVVKILDFGIVKHEHAAPTLQTGRGTAAPIGTAPYMSPEQARCSAVGPASDVYALGMMMWEMLVGEHPFLLGGAPYEFWGMLQKQVLEPVPPLTEWDFPSHLSGVAARALSKRPQDRQPNGLRFAEELLAQCMAYLRAHPNEEPNPGEPTIAWLLDANIQVPSFGTGPQSGRPSVPPPRGSKPPEGRAPTRKSVEPQPPIRFGTLPIGTPGHAERDTDPAPPPADPPAVDAEASERDTDPSGPPLEVRQFDTISLPPELRDPTAIRALAAYRPTHRRPPGGALTTGGVAVRRPRLPTDAAPPAGDRPALLPETEAAAAGGPAPDQTPPTAPSAASSSTAPSSTAPSSAAKGADATGGAEPAPAGTPTVAVVRVTKPASGAEAPPPQQAPVSAAPSWVGRGLPHVPRRLLRPALFLLGSVAVSLALSLPVHVLWPVLEAKPSRATTTPSANSAVASDTLPNAAPASSTTGSAAATVGPVVPAAAPSASVAATPPAPAAAASPVAPPAEPSASPAAPPAPMVAANPVAPATATPASRRASVAPAWSRSTSAPAASAGTQGQGTPVPGPKPPSGSKPASPAPSTSTTPAPAPSASSHRLFGTEN